MKKFLYNNSLSLALFGLFFVCIVGLVFSGLNDQNNELRSHGQPEITLGEYVVSSDFYEAVFENWESEFLQMGALVVLTIWLRQKGSADSKKLRGKEDIDTHSRYAIIRADTWSRRRRAIGHAIYGNSLSIALFVLFFLSFSLHAVSGVAAANEVAAQHGQTTQTVMQYLGSSQFWFESFQNWQSEFLSVGILIVLSIFLRQRRSPESKPVSAPNSKTSE
ncbi:MAG TPA: DUF6766 family protein [Candidatus Saccharimonadales bacterium]|nr:DUF6766 family protein [Candidatus Saccharimonadales bacterium]